MPWTCDQWTLMDRQCLPNRLFSVIDNTKGGTPAIKRLHIPQRVVPGHHRSLLFVNVCGNRISFQGIQITRIIDSKPLDCRLLILLHKNAEVIASTGEPGRRKQDGTLGTEDTYHILPIDLHTCEELCHNITGKKQRCNRILVEVRHLTDMTDSGKLHRLSHSLTCGGTGNESSHRSAIASRIQDTTAAKCVVQEATLGMSIHMEAEGGLDHTHLTNHARTDQFQEFRDLRMATIHIGFHEEDTMALRRLDDGHSLGMIERNGLLTEHMFSRLSRFNGPFSMERMRKSHIDCLHALISQHIFVTAVAMRNMPGLTKGIGGSL